MSSPRLSKAEQDERVGYASGLLSQMLSDVEICSALSRKFDCSPKLAARYLDQARKRSIFADRNKRTFQDTIGHAYAGLYRASLSRKSTVKGTCPKCEAEVQVSVPKPSIGTAAAILKGLTDLWKLQATPEDMLADAELRAATVQAMRGQADRFTDEELEAMAADFAAILERRRPAQMPLDLAP